MFERNTALIRVIICGALGRMGRMIASEIETDGHLTITGAIEAPKHPGLMKPFHGVTVTSDLPEIIDGCDVVVDFTSPQATMDHVAECAAAGKAIVSGTTGLTAGQLEAVEEVAGKIPVMISPNMSPGVNLMFRLVGDIARALPDFDIEVTEIHHNRKKDSPSGTAAKLANEMVKVRSGSRLVYGREGMLGQRRPEEIGMHSLRGGDVVGEHTVIFAGEGERLEFTHRAHSRRTFARGTLRAIHFIAGKGPGLYSMADVLGL